jgi:hypothetical protein
MDNSKNEQLSDRYGRFSGLTSHYDENDWAFLLTFLDPFFLFAKIERITCSQRAGVILQSTLSNSIQNCNQDKTTTRTNTSTNMSICGGIGRERSIRLDTQQQQDTDTQVIFNQPSQPARRQQLISLLGKDKVALIPHHMRSYLPLHLIYDPMDEEICFSCGVPCWSKTMSPWTLIHCDQDMCTGVIHKGCTEDKKIPKEAWYCEEHNQ